MPLQGRAPNQRTWTCQACDVLQLSLQTKHLTTKSASTTSAANLAEAFLQSVLLNIHRGEDLPGQGGEVGGGGSFCGPLVQSPDTVKNEGLTKSELEQGWVNWANLQG